MFKIDKILSTVIKKKAPLTIKLERMKWEYNTWNRLIYLSMTMYMTIVIAYISTAYLLINDWELANQVLVFMVAIIAVIIHLIIFLHCYILELLPIVSKIKIATFKMIFGLLGMYLIP